jgi:enterochelin esterase-like enzyme
VRRLAGAAIALALLLGGGALFASEALSVDQHGVRVIHFTVQSRLVGAHDEVVVVPPGTSGAGRPLLVFLHGKGAGRENSNLNASMFAALAPQGVRAPDIVFPDGGEDSYWHNRAGGRWSSYVLDEVIPAAVHLVGADPRRIAIGGISMGGFGALDIARLHPGRFCAVGGHSAALWFAGADTAAGAFDDAQDFAHHDVIAAARASNPYGPLPIWLDVGTDDPFRAADVALAAELRADHAEVALHVWPGGHEGSYWASHWSSYLAFYASALANCHGS